MAFSEQDKKQAFDRSGGRCECDRLEHRHGPELLGRCQQQLRLTASSLGLGRPQLIPSAEPPRLGLGQPSSWPGRSALDLPVAEIHHRTAQRLGGADAVWNAEVLCPPCHRMTDSYGRH